jgi:hypothetical protein
MFLLAHCAKFIACAEVVGVPYSDLASSPGGGGVCMPAVAPVKRSWPPQRPCRQNHYVVAEPALNVYPSTTVELGAQRTR